MSSMMLNCGAAVSGPSDVCARCCPEQSPLSGSRLSGRHSALPVLAWESRTPAGSAAGRMAQHCGLCPTPAVRSEEHTSELQSRFDLVCRLLLDKKKVKL